MGEKECMVGVGIPRFVCSQECWGEMEKVVVKNTVFNSTGVIENLMITSHYRVKLNIESSNKLFIYIKQLS